ncbi:hypothetical protein Scep_019616 [Stephania cephalantha]|uniref:Retrotransposon Copia-like N-terminal domain-containing protein n=1 Tax=Stephania cephalantha TaxID=152367 RepID=A0AAP0IBM6_9MAGN
MKSQLTLIRVCDSSRSPHSTWYQSSTADAMEGPRCMYVPEGSSSTKMNRVDELTPINNGLAPHNARSTSSTNRFESQGIRSTAVATGSASSTLMMTPFGNSLNQIVTMKLDRTNYLFWKAIVLPFFRGCKLDGHLLGTILIPLKILANFGLPNP